MHAFRKLPLSQVPLVHGITLSPFPQVFVTSYLSTHGYVCLICPGFCKLYLRATSLVFSFWLNVTGRSVMLRVPVLFTVSAG